MKQKKGKNPSSTTTDDDDDNKHQCILNNNNVSWKMTATTSAITIKGDAIDLNFKNNNNNKRNNKDNKLATIKWKKKTENFYRAKKKEAQVNVCVWFSILMIDDW